MTSVSGCGGRHSIAMRGFCDPGRLRADRRRSLEAVQALQPGIGREVTAAEGKEPGEWLWSVTIPATTTAADALGHVHDRSPVVLPAELRAAWLDPTLTEHDQVRALLTQMPEPRLVPREVSTAVNSPRNNSADVLEAV